MRSGLQVLGRALSCLADGHGFALCSHGPLVQAQVENSLSGVSSSKDTDPIMRALLLGPHLILITCQSPISKYHCILGVRTQCMNWGRGRPKQ